MDRLVTIILNDGMKLSLRKQTDFLERGLPYGLILLFIFLPSCKKNDPGLTEQQKTTALLTSATAWYDPTVTVDEVDYSDIYADFQINFSTGTYASTGGTPLWAPSGTWIFINDEATRMKLDGVREVEISVSDDFLELSFQWEENTFEPGRMKSVKGKQKFKLKKKKP